MKRILIVCEANICRSPMAQGLLAAALPQSQVRSAGLNAIQGTAADPAAIRLMAARGVDIAGHAATQLTRDLCLQADLVLVMSRDQRQQLETKYPSARGRIFRMCEVAAKDVPDPYGKPENAFQEAMALIDQGVSAWSRRIRQF